MSVFDGLDDEASKGSQASATEEPKPIVDGNVAHDFKEDFLNWIVNGKTDSPRAPGLHCSSLWRTCPRVPLLKKKYAEYLTVEKLSAGQQLTFGVGHALHDLMQNTLLGPFGRLWGDWKCLSCQETTHKGTMPEVCAKCGVKWRDEKDGIQNIVYSELFVADDVLKYCGHCDGVMLSRAGEKFIFEFKTISKSQYGGLRQPKHEHVIQVHAYMNALGIDQAVILYLDKGSQADWRKKPDGWTCTNPHLKSFLVKFDSSVWEPVIDRIRDYHKADETAKRLPVVTVEDINAFDRVCTHKGCDLAGDCDVRDLCFAI